MIPHFDPYSLTNFLDEKWLKIQIWVPNLHVHHGGFHSVNEYLPYGGPAKDCKVSAPETEGNIHGSEMDHDFKGRLNWRRLAGL